MNLGIGTFFQDIGNFFKGGAVLGISIGTVSVKAVQIRKKGDKFHLENYSILETKEYLNQGNQAIQTSSLKIVEAKATKLVENALNEMKPKTKIAVVSLPNFGAFTTLIDMPMMSMTETAKSITFQARQYIPAATSNVSIEWSRIGEFTNEKGQKLQKILLTGIPNDIINSYKNIFSSAGIKVFAFEVESHALVRGTLGEPGVRMIIDIGAESTTIVIAEDAVTMYVSDTEYGGAYLTKAVSRGLEISATRAEELKKRRGLSKTGADKELSTLILPFLDVIINESRRISSLFTERYGKKVERVILGGGGGKLIGLPEHIETQLNLPVRISEPLKKLTYPSLVEPSVKDLNPELLVPIGLALRYFE